MENITFWMHGLKLCLTWNSIWKFQVTKNQMDHGHLNSAIESHNITEMVLNSLWINEKDRRFIMHGLKWF
jgi:hypothetical protein